MSDNSASIRQVEVSLRSIGVPVGDVDGVRDAAWDNGVVEALNQLRQVVSPDDPEITSLEQITPDLIEKMNSDIAAYRQGGSFRSIDAVIRADFNNPVLGMHSTEEGISIGDRAVRRGKREAAGYLHDRSDVNGSVAKIITEHGDADAKASFASLPPNIRTNISESVTLLKNSDAFLRSLGTVLAADAAPAPAPAVQPAVQQPTGGAPAGTPVSQYSAAELAAMQEDSGSVQADGDPNQNPNTNPDGSAAPVGAGGEVDYENLTPEQNTIYQVERQLGLIIGGINGQIDAKKASAAEGGGMLSALSGLMAPGKLQGLGAADTNFNTISNQALQGLMEFIRGPNGMKMASAGPNDPLWLYTPEVGARLLGSNKDGPWYKYMAANPAVADQMQSAGIKPEELIAHLNLLHENGLITQQELERPASTAGGLEGIQGQILGFIAGFIKDFCPPDIYAKIDEMTGGKLTELLPQDHGGPGRGSRGPAVARGDGNGNADVDVDVDGGSPPALGPHQQAAQRRQQANAARTASVSETELRTDDVDQLYETLDERTQGELSSMLSRDDFHDYHAFLVDAAHEELAAGGPRSEMAENVLQKAAVWLNERTDGRISPDVTDENFQRYADQVSAMLPPEMRNPNQASHDLGDAPRDGAQLGTARGHGGQRRGGAGSGTPPDRTVAESIDQIGPMIETIHRDSAKASGVPMDDVPRTTPEPDMAFFDGTAEPSDAAIEETRRRSPGTSQGAFGDAASGQTPPPPGPVSLSGDFVATDPVVPAPAVEEPAVDVEPVDTFEETRREFTVDADEAMSDHSDVFATVPAGAGSEPQPAGNPR